MTKPTKRHVRPVKTQIRLGMHPVWSESSLSTWRKLGVLNYPLSAQWSLWSDWADAQADLTLRWAHSQFVGFVMRRLIYWTRQWKQYMCDFSHHYNDARFCILLNTFPRWAILGHLQASILDIATDLLQPVSQNMHWPIKYGKNLRKINMCVVLRQQFLL